MYYIITHHTLSFLVSAPHSLSILSNHQSVIILGAEIVTFPGLLTREIWINCHQSIMCNESKRWGKKEVAYTYTHKNSELKRIWWDGGSLMVMIWWLWLWNYEKQTSSFFFVRVTRTWEFPRKEEKQGRWWRKHKLREQSKQKRKAVNKNNQNSLWM